MTDVHPGLVELAEQLETTPDVATDAHGRPWACERCTDCDGAIIPAGQVGRLRHLTSDHGWRMDGRQYDNANRLIKEL